MSKKKRIALGSGKLYTMEFDGENIPEDSVIETEENLLGAIQGGASIEYKSEYYVAEDDLGLVKKTILTKEEATLKSGVMTWNGETLKRLCSTARVTEDIETGRRNVKIGGIGNQDGKQYVIRFVNLDAQDGDTRITIVGKNESGFTFAFTKDKETVIDTEFRAIPHDTEGTLIIYSETIPTDKSLAVLSASGTESGKTVITVTPEKGATNSYLYETAKIVTLPQIGEDCSAGYTAWDGTAEIVAITGNEIGIIEVAEQNKAVKIGKSVVISKA